MHVGTTRPRSLDRKEKGRGGGGGGGGGGVRDWMY